MNGFDDAPPSVFGSGGEEVADPLEYVSFWPRVLAQVVDTAVHYGTSFTTGLVLAFVSYIVQGAMGASRNVLIESMQETHWSLYVFALLGSLSYHSVMESVHGSTVGKRLVGITVHSAKGRGCTFLQGIKRSVALLVDSLFFGIVAAGAMGNSRRQQRLGDQWADTVVVRIRSLPASERGKALRFAAALVGGIAADAIVLGSGIVLAAFG